ncbi:hypothetical protein PMIN06_004039 [Paraphaeosphaeria minitans]
MATSGCDMAWASRQLNEQYLQQLTDTDMELSDYPDDLSEWSLARGDVHAKEQAAPFEDYTHPRQDIQVEEHPQASQEARVEDYVRVDQEAHPELDVAKNQSAQADSAAEDLHQVEHTRVEKFMGSSEQASAHLTESVSGPVHDDEELQDQGLPSPPRSQTSGNEALPPQTSIPATPTPAAATNFHSLPSSTLPISPISPMSVNDSLDQPRSTRKRTTPKRGVKPRQTGRSNRLVPATPSIPITPRRSGRTTQPPARFSGMRFPGSCDPSPASEPAQESKIVTFNLPVDALRQIQQQFRPSKRRREPQDSTSLSKKKNRNADSPNHETRELNAQAPDLQVQKEQGQTTVHHLLFEELLPPQSVANLPEPLVSDVPEESDSLWSTGKELMAYAHPSGIPQELKPEPRGRPPVFANERYELVESIVNCKIYQSGCSTKDKLVYAYLYTGHPALRDFVDFDTVIARASGGMETDGKTKERRVAEDQDENATKTQALKNTMRAYNPVVLITKNDNPLMPSHMPQKYCVLGHYKPTNIWTEEQNGKKVVRYRFERLNPQDEPAWFQPKGVEGICRLGSLERPVVRSCPTCRKSCPQVYLQGWVCLNGNCQAFWKLTSSSGELKKLNYEGLVYDPRFLKQKTKWPGEHLQPSLGYRPLEVSEDTRAEDFYTRAAWNGMICPRCNGCILRTSFLGWDCKTPECGFQFHPPRKAIPASALTDSGAAFTLTDGYTPSRDLVFAKEIRRCKPHYANNYRTDVYDFPIPGCYMAHKIANKTINEAPGGPNDIFKELQLVDIGLRRRKITPEGQEDPSYCRHMNQNFGVNYKFTGTGIDNSRSFEEAETPVIREIRTRMNWSAVDTQARYDDKPFEEVAAAWKPVEFNEELVLSYFEDQGIGFHDDGEQGVGPVIGTLSIGDTGKMQVRMKGTRYFGVSRSGVYDHKYPPIPGCLKYKERLARHDQIVRDAPEKFKDKQNYWKEVAQDLGLKRGKSQQPPNALEMVLPNGDEVFMVGHPIQAYYEHSVTHQGKMRFALTCRYIDFKFGKPNFEVGPDMGHYDGSALPMPRDAAGDVIPNDGKFEIDVRDDEMEETEDVPGAEEDVERGGEDEEGQ